jgi:hypothetical protein
MRTPPIFFSGSTQNSVLKMPAQLMGGHGSFSDQRIGLFIEQTPDLLAPKPPAGTINRNRALRGQQLFQGAARCGTCHQGPTFTDVLGGPNQGPRLHDAAETGMDPRYAERSATGRYRTTAPPICEPWWTTTTATSAWG